MSVLNSEIEPEKGSRFRGLITALGFIAGFTLIYFFGYYGGLLIKARTSGAAPCAQGYSGSPCEPIR